MTRRRGVSSRCQTHAGAVGLRPPRPWPVRRGIVIPSWSWRQCAARFSKRQRRHVVAWRKQRPWKWPYRTSQTRSGRKGFHAKSLPLLQRLCALSPPRSAEQREFRDEGLARRHHECGGDADGAARRRRTGPAAATPHGVVAILVPAKSRHHAVGQRVLRAADSCPRQWRAAPPMEMRCRRQVASLRFRAAGFRRQEGRARRSTSWTATTRLVKSDLKPACRVAFASARKK